MYRPILILTALLACPGGALAQAPLAYDSAFAGYQKYVEPKVADWKATNAAIAAAPGHGGHDGHGAHKPDPHAGHDMTAAPAPEPAAVRPAAPAKGATDPHAEHKH